FSSCLSSFCCWNFSLSLRRRLRGSGFGSTGSVWLTPLELLLTGGAASWPHAIPHPAEAAASTAVRATAGIDRPCVLISCFTPAAGILCCPVPVQPPHRKCGRAARLRAHPYLIALSALLQEKQRT